LISNLMH